MIYVNDCSIRVVRSCIKIFVQEISNFAYENYFTKKKKQITVQVVDTYKVYSACGEQSCQECLEHLMVW